MPPVGDDACDGLTTTGDPWDELLLCSLLLEQLSMTESMLGWQAIRLLVGEVRTRATYKLSAATMLSVSVSVSVTGTEMETASCKRLLARRESMSDCLSVC